MSVIAVFASDMVYIFIWDKLERVKNSKFYHLFIHCHDTLYRGLTDDIYKNYLGRFTSVVLIVIMLIAFICILYRKKRVFYPIMLVIITVSGVTVNPVTHGIGAIENKLLYS